MTQKNGQQAILAQHALVMLGFFMPLGEVFGSWVGLKMCPTDMPEARRVMRKNWAFQLSWAMVRFGLVITVFLWTLVDQSTPSRARVETSRAVETESIPADSEDQHISIPGEPDRMKDPLVFEDTSTFRFFSQNESITSHLPQGATFVMRLIFAISGFVLIWMMIMFISMINLARVAMGLSGFYPLILPWLREKKLGPEATKNEGPVLPDPPATN